MQIDWWTLALQTINFLVLVWLLWRFLYRPVKEVIEKRKALAKQAFADADSHRREADAERQRYKKDRADLERERQEMLKNIHDELETERCKVIEKAKQQAEDLLQAANKSITQQRKAVLVEIREELAALAVEMASDILRKTKFSISSEQLIEQLEQQLKDLPTEEHERLKKDIAGESARLTVVTATALTQMDQSRWADGLAEWLGQEDKVDFVTDPEILGGAELRFPHAVLKLTWADQLRKAENLLRKDEATS